MTLSIFIPVGAFAAGYLLRGWLAVLWERKRLRHDAPGATFTVGYLLRLAVLWKWKRKRCAAKPAPTVNDLDAMLDAMRESRQRQIAALTVNPDSITRRLQGAMPEVFGSAKQNNEDGENDEEDKRKGRRIVT